MMARFTVADLEIEKPREPFELEMPDGKVYSFQDPKAIQLDSLIDMEILSSREQVAALMPEGEFTEFASRSEVDGLFFDAVMTKYNKHFGLGEAAEKKGSLRSLNGTGKRSKSTSRSAG